MRRKSAVAGLLDSLDEGLSRVSPAERKQTLSAGAKLLSLRQALLAKPRRRGAVRPATRDRIRVAG